MDRPEQQQVDKAAKPPIHGLPRREVDRKHPPLASGAHHVAQRVDNLPKVGCPLAPPRRRLWQQAVERAPFLIGQVARISLRLLFNGHHPPARRCAPHPQFESRPANRFKPFSNSL
jgi:hypothetical protein